jgi:hypothetical protein
MLAYSFAKHPNALTKMVAGPNIPGIAAHREWVELCLAFGIPIEGLFFPVLLVTFIEVARHAYPARMTVLGFIVLLACW